MRLFRPTYTTRAGRRRQSPRWHVECKDHTGQRRRLAAFTDKAASDELGRKCEKRPACSIAGYTVGCTESGHRGPPGSTCDHSCRCAPS